MEVKLEFLATNDLPKYKELVDHVLGNTISLAVMQAKYQPDHPTVKTVVAKNGLAIVGAITFVLIDTFAPKVEFSNFAVNPAARGTNVAAMLMDFVLGYVQERNYSAVVVNCDVNAERAHRFYEKMGFTRIERARFVKNI